MRRAVKLAEALLRLADASNVSPRELLVDPLPKLTRAEAEDIASRRPYSASQILAVFGEIEPARLDCRVVWFRRPPPPRPLRL